MSGHRIGFQMDAAGAIPDNWKSKPMADRPDSQTPPSPAPRLREPEQIRLRIATGFYDRRDVVLEIATRILQERALTSEN
jgi:hypothetical protein